MDELLHLTYIPEVNDCYQIVRRYFAFLGIELTDYAFPSDFWEFEDSMYERLFERTGFINVDTDQWVPAINDVIMVPGNLRCSFPTHIGVLVEDNKILHHYTGRRSELTPFKGIWRTPSRVVRHRDLVQSSVATSTKLIDLKEIMPDHVRRRIESIKPV